jgi:hypothetical protein
MLDHHIIRYIMNGHPQANLDAEKWSLSKQKKFAWAQYYKMMDRVVILAQTQLHMRNAMRGEQQPVASNGLEAQALKEALDLDFLKKSYLQCLEQLSKLVACPVCLEIKPSNDLSVLNCGHILCKACKIEVGKMSAEHHKCPQCRRTIYFKLEPKAKIPIVLKS